MKYRWKSKETQRFVTAEFAKQNPKTCYKHEVKKYLDNPWSF